MIDEVQHPVRAMKLDSWHLIDSHYAQGSRDDGVRYTSICGRDADENVLTGSTLPMSEKTCETCLRIERKRREARAKA